MRSLDVGQMVFPLVILLIKDDEDRNFLIELYRQYYGLLYKTASKYFHGNYEEIADAVSACVERICRYCQKIKAIPGAKRAAYLVKIMRSVCNTRWGELQKQAGWEYPYINVENIVDLGSHDDLVFNYLYATDLLNSFDDLSDMDKQLIRMRHIDAMSYEEIANILSISEGAARTAVSRAKSRLEKSAKKRGQIPDA